MFRDEAAKRIELETRPGSENEKAFRPRQTENEGKFNVPEKTVHGAGLILLFDGEVDLAEAKSGRARTNRYPDFGLQTSLPPSRCVTSGMWEFVARYSGVTVPEFHGVLRHLLALQWRPKAAAFKERRHYYELEIGLANCSGRILNFPEIVDLALPTEGDFHSLVFVSIRKTYPMHA